MKYEPSYIPSRKIMSNVVVPLLLLTITVALVKLCTSGAIGSTLTPNQSLADGDFLISDGQTFTLGFFRPGNSAHHYLGVWYNNISEQTVVWVANRNSPFNDSSGLVSFNAAGNLILTARNSSTKNNTPLWSTNVSAASHDGSNNVVGSVSARLLNTGNLEIIQLPSRRVVWQSFDYLTDTVLPFMKLGLDRKTGLNWFINSWKAHDDPGTGSYTYRIDPTGTPQLCLFKGPARTSWRAGPWNGVRWSGIRKMSTRYIFRGSYADNRDELSITYGIYDPSILTRLVVDESGSVNRLTWDEAARRWIRFSYVPEDTCDLYGQCGAYGVCDPNRETGEFECKCLPGYTPRSPRGWYLRDGSGGCVRERSISMCGNGEGFTRIARAKVPDTRVAHVNMGASGEACRQECLRNCSCMAYTSANVSGSGSGCLAWYGDLVDLKVYPNPSDGQDLYVRIDAVDLASERKMSKGFRGAKRTLLISLPLVIFVGLLLGTARYCWCIWHSRFAELCSSNNADYSKYEEESEGTGGKRKINMHFFRLSEIKSATNNFSMKLGEGGFGAVYKGQFGADGLEIAVKRLSKFSGQGAEEFKNEILVIARLQHRNLVRILGCCIQDEEKMLIYEYMTNKSLDSFIFDSSRNAMLDWKKRYEIIIGIGRGVLYLHQDSRLKIVHRDLKASNILLDCEMNPKISDFGMARIFGGNQSQANTKRVVGTLGYMSPEYALNGIFSTKSDVFSFGVLILEIIYGKKNFASYNNDPFSTLIKYVWELWQDNRALSIIEPSIGDSWEECEVLRCIHVGLLCVQESPVDRPNMSTVVLMLNNDKRSLPPPKQPALAIGKSYKTRVESTSCPSDTNDVTITLPR